MRKMAAKGVECADGGMSPSFGKRGGEFEGGKVESAAEYELLISKLHEEYEKKMSVRVAEERNKITQELKSKYESEVPIKVKKQLAMKEQQLKAQLRNSVYEQIRKEMHSQDYSRLYDDLKAKAMGEVQETLDRICKERVNAETEKVRRAAEKEVQETTAKLKQEVEARLLRHAERLSLEAKLRTDRECQSAKQRYLR